MSLNLIEEYLDGVKLFYSDIYSDSRGYFCEFFRTDYFKKFGLPENFPQDNISVSKQNVLRGLHFQWDKPMGKFIRVAKGSAIFIEVDLRPNSPNFGKYMKALLSDQNKYLLWSPAGFANGFLALEDDTEVNYKCTEIYNPLGEGSLLWNDSALNIDWEISAPIVSERDSQANNFEYWANSGILENFKY